MSIFSTQTFFLPRLFSSRESTLNAHNFNLAHTLLNRTESSYLFVPIRNMQYLAVIEANDIWFVDSQAYAVNDNEGGRMITVSWHTDSNLNRNSLVQHVPIKIHFYDRDMSEIQMRLTGEFLRAMQQMDLRYRDEQVPQEGARIIPLKR